MCRRLVILLAIKHEDTLEIGSVIIQSKREGKEE